MFVSYSHVDEGERVRLDVHLAPLAREQLIDLWCNRVIAPGSDWERDIEDELASADIVILLVTPDFVASAFCFEKEFATALRRHDEEGVPILPVLVKPVDYAHMPFGQFQALPRDLRPISTWANPDAGWLEVALGVRAGGRGGRPLAPGHSDAAQRIGGRCRADLARSQAQGLLLLSDR